MCYEASEKPTIASIIDNTENVLFRDQGNNFLENIPGQDKQALGVTVLPFITHLYAIFFTLEP